MILAPSLVRGIVGAIVLTAAPSVSGPLTNSDHWLPRPLDEYIVPTSVHYLVSNESRSDLFGPWIAGRGGAYLGVGAAQNYTMIGIAEPKLAFLLDRDPMVVELHRELGRRITASPDPETLIQGLGTTPEGLLAETWPSVADHLRRVAAREIEGRPTTWLGDSVLYDRVRALWIEGRIFPVLGDLTGPLAMPSIASAAAARGQRFSVIYLSNAEEPLDRRALTEQLAAFPRRPGAVVLRTYFSEHVPAADGLWSYQVHELDALLRSPSSRTEPAQLRSVAGEPGLSVIRAQ